MVRFRRRAWFPREKRTRTHREITSVDRGEKHGLGISSPLKDTEGTIRETGRTNVSAKNHYLYLWRFGCPKYFFGSNDLQQT